MQATSAPTRSPLADWWWYSCVAVAGVVGMLGLALDLYNRHFFVRPESHMQSRAAAIGMVTESGALVGLAGFSLLVALPALLLHKLRWSDLLALALPASCLFAVLIRR
jgi:hypothetical protein